VFTTQYRVQVQQVQGSGSGVGAGGRANAFVVVVVVGGWLSLCFSYARCERVGVVVSCRRVCAELDYRPPPPPPQPPRPCVSSALRCHLCFSCSCSFLLLLLLLLLILILSSLSRRLYSLQLCTLLAVARLLCSPSLVFASPPARTEHTL